jgi:hypothetical protein
MSEEENREEKKEENQPINDNEESGTLQEKQTISKDQNTISSNKNKSKKKKPNEIEIDTKNSMKETNGKNKFKNAYSSQSLQ